MINELNEIIFIKYKIKLKFWYLSLTKQLNLVLCPNKKNFFLFRLFFYYMITY